jgi:hypothetical protein
MDVLNSGAFWLLLCEVNFHPWWCPQIQAGVLESQKQERIPKGKVYRYTTFTGYGDSEHHHKPKQVYVS